MELVIRKRGAHRSKKPIEVIFEPNWAGQGGLPRLTFFDPENQMYYIFNIRGLEEGRRLLSEAHIAYHNVQAKEDKLVFLAKYGIGTGDT